MFDLLVKNGYIVGIDQIRKKHIYIKDEKISILSESLLDVEVREEIDAREMLVFPGGVDTHAHFNDPGYNWREDYIHGSKAAAKGGITTIIDMPLQNEPALTSKLIFKEKEDYLKDKSIIDFAFWGGLVHNIEEIEGI